MQLSTGDWKLRVTPVQINKEIKVFSSDMQKKCWVVKTLLKNIIQKRKKNHLLFLKAVAHMWLEHVCHFAGTT